jgi:hypothetical protein
VLKVLEMINQAVDHDSLDLGTREKRDGLGDAAKRGRGVPKSHYDEVWIPKGRESQRKQS